jgi:diguanylate cyclase (GGDEF)-like protein/PAS domain S-box-containing protein
VAVVGQSAAPFAKAAGWAADLVGMVSEAPLDDAARDAVFEALLRQHPTAHVAAIARNGLFVPMPASVPLSGQRVIRGASSMLDLVIAEDRLKVIETWEHACVHGASSEVVHTLGDAGQSATLYYVDVTHHHGVVLGFLAGLDTAPGMPALDQVVLPPRVSVIRKNRVAVITEVDEAATRILGWTAEELIGRRTTEFIHPEDHERGIASWMDMLARPGSTRRVRMRHRHRDGSWIWFEVTNHNMLDEHDGGFVLTEMVDISDEMAALEALRSSEQLLRRLTEALPVGVLQLDTERQVVYRNERLAAIVGDDAAGTVDAQLAVVLPDDRGALERALAAVLNDGCDGDLEVGYRHPVGGNRRCSVSLRALTAEDGKVTGAILCMADVTEDARLREELKHRATYDPLTHCLNRASTLATLEELLSIGREDEGAAVVFVDLDKFKELNDRLGHAAGDRLLAHVGESLLGAVREGDLVGRLGGDEFLIICRQVHTPDEALAIAERIADEVRRSRLGVNGEQVVPRLSIGIAWTPAAACTADALIARADEAMYESKRYRGGAPTLAPELPLGSTRRTGQGTHPLPA